MRGAGIALALAKYLACPVYGEGEEWQPGSYIACESCPLTKQPEHENLTICEILYEIDGALEDTNESEFA